LHIYKGDKLPTKKKKYGKRKLGNNGKEIKYQTLIFFP